MLNKLPELHSATALLGSDVYRNTSQNHGKKGWHPARPHPYWPANPFAALRKRIVLAYYVFTGKYDAIYWGPHDQR